MWRKLSRSQRRRRKRDWCVIDVDGHVKELCGVQKQGADFSYNGKWSYRPLIVSMASVVLRRCLVLFRLADHPS